MFDKPVDYTWLVFAFRVRISTYIFRVYSKYRVILLIVCWNDYSCNIGVSNLWTFLNFSWTRFASVLLSRSFFFIRVYSRCTSVPSFWVCSNSSQYYLRKVFGMNECSVFLRDQLRLYWELVNRYLKLMSVPSLQRPMIGH